MMSNDESDRVEQILDLIAQEQTAEASFMLQEAEASQREEEAAEFESCRKLLNGVIAIREGRFEVGMREALPALTFLEGHFRRKEEQYRSRLIAVAGSADLLVKLELARLAKNEMSQLRDRRTDAAQPSEQPRAWQDESLRDPLTGCLNRRGFALHSEAMFAPGERLALALVDADHFKAINDRYGHEVGDRVLQTLARIFKDSLRGSDLVARYGGEEFLLLLHSIGVDTAWGICERLRQAVEHHGWANIHAGLHVTVSIGLAARTNDETLDAVTACADTALYQAKSEGRNRVVAGK